MGHLVRVSFTMPSDLSRKLGSVSKFAGVSKSALLSDLIGPALNDMHGLIIETPESPTADDVRRLSGKSIAICEERLGKLREMSSDV